MKYPIGMQSFDQIREEGYVYVDKTALVYELANNGYTSVTCSIELASRTEKKRSCNEPVAKV